MYIFYRDYFCHIASFWYHSTNPLQFSLTPVLPKNNTIPPKKTNTQLVGGSTQLKNSPNRNLPARFGVKMKKKMSCHRSSPFGLSGFQRAVSWHHGSSSSINSQVRQLIQGPFNLGDVTDEFHRNRWGSLKSYHPFGFFRKTAGSSKTGLRSWEPKKIRPY